MSLTLSSSDRKENTEQFLEDQYGRPYVAVRLGKDKILAIIPLKSIIFPGCLEKIDREKL